MAKAANKASKGIHRKQKSAADPNNTGFKFTKKRNMPTYNKKSKLPAISPPPAFQLPEAKRNGQPDKQYHWPENPTEF